VNFRKIHARFESKLEIGKILSTFVDNFRIITYLLWLIFIVNVQVIVFYDVFFENSVCGDNDIRSIIET